MSEMQEVKGDVVLVLTVVLDDGQEVIEVREQDSPDRLAEEFCKKHKLEASIVPSMSKFIEQQIKESEEPQDTGLLIKLKPAISNHAGERLYKKAVEKRSLLRQKSEGQLNLQISDEEFPFKPSINKNYRAHTPINSEKPRSLASSKLSSNSSSYQRLYEEAKARKVKAQKIAEDYLKETCPFKPKLVARSKSVRSIVQDSELMSDPIELRGSLYQEEVPVRRSRPQTANLSRASTPYTREESRGKRRFQSIFEKLKPTKKGTLNCATITRCNLTDEQAVFLRPILEKLVTSDLEMGFEEFCIDIAHLQKVRNVKDLSKLFGTGRITPISRLSRIRKRDPSTIKLKPNEATEFYSRQLARQNIKQAFLRTVRKRLEARELAECTFKPKTNVSSANQSIIHKYRRVNSSSHC